MNSSFNLKTANRFLGSSLSRSCLWCGLFLIAVVLACLGLSPRVQAVSPPPDGGYPGNNTAEGDFALLSLTTGTDNTALGTSALVNNTTGSDNTAVGFFALVLNATGNANTATGVDALRNNTTGGDENTATGLDALFSNTIGSDNTATGAGALDANFTGGDNTATGQDALFHNTIAFSNTADGFEALFRNATGSDNTATGIFALFNNNVGDNNTATGFQALFNNTTGGFNTADGWQALQSNSTSFSNVATGFQALFHTTGGTGENTASGSQALTSNTTGGGNTASGFQALFSNGTGAFNIALGYQAGSNLTTGSHNIDIGNSGVVGESSTIRIGDVQTKTFIQGISGAAVSGSPVLVNASGQLGVVTSSARYKEEIRLMDKTSEVILALRPVTFRYKKAIDPNGIRQFGLVAEQVEKVNPDLVVRDDKGEVYTVRYDAVNAMLLNEFLKEHRKVQEQEATIVQLKVAAARQDAADAEELEAMLAITAHLKEQDSKIQKVSDQLQVSELAPQIVANNQ